MDDDDDDDRDDDELLQAWRAGDRRAGEILVARHFEPVHRFFRTKVTEPADMVQRTFLACLEHLDRFRGDASFRTFLFAIAHNVLRKHYRELGGPRGKVDLGTVSAEDLQPSPSRVLAESDERQLLLRALRRLSVEQQVLIELHYWEQLKVAELAAVLELPVGTVKTRMRAARKRLEELIAELAASPALVESTMTRLDEWAEGLRGALCQEFTGPADPNAKDEITFKVTATSNTTGKVIQGDPTLILRTKKDGDD